MSNREMSGKDALVPISTAKARDILELCRMVQDNYDYNTGTAATTANELAEQAADIAYAALHESVPEPEDMARRIMRKNGEYAQLKIDEAAKSIQHLTESLSLATKALETAKQDLATHHKLKETDVQKANDKAESAIAQARTALIEILGFPSSGIDYLSP